MRMILNITTCFLFLTVVVAAETEIIEKRSFFSKTFHIEQENYKTVLSTVPLHYIDDLGQFQQIVNGDERDWYLNLALQQIENASVDYNNNAKASYSEYEYQIMETEWNGSENDTTYTDTTGYGYSSEAEISHNIWSGPPYNASEEGITSEIWRGLMSWCTSCGSIPGNSIIDSLYLQLNLNRVIVLQPREFGLELTLLENHSITDSPGEDDYDGIANSTQFGSFIVVQDSYSSPYNHLLPAFSEGEFFTDFVNSVETQESVFTIGIKHESEDYSGYTDQESPWTFVNSGQITVHYTLPTIDIELVNCRMNIDASNVDGFLSLEHLSGASDYYNQPSGTEITVTIDENYTISTHDEWLTDNSDSLKYLSWNFNNEFKMINSNFLMEPEYQKLAAEFELTYTITIEENDVEIQDPWFVRNDGTQTGEDWVETDGTYSVFLNQNEFFDEDLPIYSLRAQAFTDNGNQTYSIFDKWVARNTAGAELPSDPIFNGHEHDLETPVVFTADVASVEAECIEVTIIGDEAELRFENGNYLLEAPALYATTETIYKFIRWIGTGAEFENTTSNQTVVNFTEPNAEVVASFLPTIFNNHGLTINSELIIPAGANYEMNFGFEFRIREGGHLTLAGTAENPVELVAQSSDRVWSGIDVQSQGYNTLSINHTVISGADIAINFHENAVVDMHALTNITFVNNEVAVKIEDSYMDIPSIVNCVFANNIVALDLDLDDCQIGRQPPPDEGDDPTLWLTIHHCLFYNNSEDIDDHNQTGYYVTDNLIMGQNPLFVDIASDDYHLQSGSPCIDSGDPNSPDDPDSTIADMGAYYYDQLIIPTNLSISGEVGDNPTLTWEYESFDHYQHHEIWRYYESLNIDGIIKGASSDYTFTDVEYVISKIDEEPDGRLRYEVKKVDPGTGHHQRVNYQVRAVNESNQPYQYSNQVHTYRLLPGAISKGTNLPTEFALSQNYPNPFNSTTVISYQLSVISEVQLTVYDLMGRVVRELVSSKRPAGTHHIIWNGTDTHGQPVASGMYLYQLKTDTFVKTKKLVLLK